MKWPQDVIGRLSLLSLLFPQCCRRQLAEACRPCSLERVAHAAAPQQGLFLPCAVCACVSTCRCLMFRWPTIQQRLYITRKTWTVLCKWLEENVSVGTGHRARPQRWPSWTDPCVASVLFPTPMPCVTVSKTAPDAFPCTPFLVSVSGVSRLWKCMLVHCRLSVSSNWLLLSYVYGSEE